MQVNSSSGNSRLSNLPSTPLGRISVVIFLVAVVLMVLLSTVLESDSLTLGSLNVAGLVTFVALLASLIPGAVAIVRDRERSWAVWLATGLPAIVLGFEVVSWLVPGA